MTHIKITSAFLFSFAVAAQLDGAMITVDHSPADLSAITLGTTIHFEMKISLSSADLPSGYTTAELMHSIFSGELTTSDGTTGTNIGGTFPNGHTQANYIADVTGATAYYVGGTFPTGDFVPLTFDWTATKLGTWTWKFGVQFDFWNSQFGDNATRFPGDPFSVTVIEGSVPEPASIIMALTGCCGLGLAAGRRRRRTKAAAA